MRPHDYAEPLMRIEKLNKEIFQALLERQYKEASEIAGELMTETGRLMIWLQGKRDGEF